MQRKTFTRSLLALAAVALLPLAVQAQNLKLTLGHGAAPDNPRNLAAVKFAETVKAKTNGRIEIQVAHSAQLGDDAAMVTALRSGTLDMSANSQGAVATVVLTRVACSIRRASACPPAWCTSSPRRAKTMPVVVAVATSTAATTGTRRTARRVKRFTEGSTPRA